MPAGRKLLAQYGFKAQYGFQSARNVTRYMSHISKLVRASSDGVKKTMFFLFGARGFRKVALESSIARNSIGNRFPVQKYVGAMVRKSIRVLLAADNEPLDHGCFRSTFPIRPETQDT